MSYFNRKLLSSWLLFCAVSLFAVCNVECFVGNNFRFECGDGLRANQTSTELMQRTIDLFVSFSTHSKIHKCEFSSLVWRERRRLWLILKMQTMDKQLESRASMLHHLMFLFIFVLCLPILSVSLCRCVYMFILLFFFHLCFVIHTPLYLPVSVHNALGDGSNQQIMAQPWHYSYHFPFESCVYVRYSLNLRVIVLANVHWFFFISRSFDRCV